MGKLAARLILRPLEKLHHGRLALELPDGSRKILGRGQGRPTASIRIHDWSFFRRRLLDVETGVGKSYIEGEWDCDDLVALVRLAIDNRDAMATALTEHAKLGIEGLENIGIHHAETLRRWRVNFLERAAEVRRLGFGDSFSRRWEFYLAYCEGGFAARNINDLQLVHTRAANRALPVWPCRLTTAVPRPTQLAHEASVRQGALP